MCGIAGFVGDGRLADLHAMLDALQHRGPDGAGDWSSLRERVFLGHRRLAIIDVPDGSQPMSTRDGRLIVTFNGEIYNHVDLRRRLAAAGHVFATDHCDTEVLLHGYREWGAALPARLNGMWAFAIYDVDRRRLFLSRDRFGQKPLYYTCRNGTFAFASEVSALLQHPQVSPSVSRLSICKYLACGFVPAPDSLYEGISKLPGGHNLSFDLESRRIDLRRYWDFLLEPDDSLLGRNESDLADELRELLRTAVRRQLMSDVPIGSFLSGGLDSSIVACLASQAAPARPWRTFALGFQEPEFDESGNARQVAARLGTDHADVQFTPAEFARVAEAAVDRIDEPLADSSLIPTSLLCRFARQHVTVALGGDGADELFCGYDTFRAVRLAERYARCVPRPVHAAIRAACAWLPDGRGYMSLPFRMQRMLRGLSYSPGLWNPVWLGAVDPAEFQDCFADPPGLEDIYAEAIELWDASPTPDAVDRTTQFYVKLYFQDGILAKLDRAGMQHALEIRCPFLDTDVVDFVRRLPQRLKLRSARTKYLLRKSMQAVLPPRILEQAKHGFPFPVAQWLRAGHVAIDASHPLPGQRTEFLQQRLQNHRQGRRDERLLLWSHWVMHRFLARHA